MYKHLALDLVKIFNEGAFITIALDNSLKNLKLTDHQKKLYSKILYGVTENKILIDYYLQPLIKGKRVKPFVKNILRIGCYVIDYMNMKDYFIVNELVKVVKKEDYKSSMFVNAVLRSYQREEKRSFDNLSNVEKLSIELSLPLELTDLLYKQYKDQIKDFFKHYEPLNSYRINTLKTSINDVCMRLEQEEIKYELMNSAILTKTSLLNHQLFNEGMIIAQDISSMRVSEVLNPVPGSMVLDTCSAPGGKSLHIASLMNNKGKILSCDIYDHKLQKINDNALKLGVKIINTLNASATSYDYGILFDYVVADVPCSGLGVINHKPDLKYHISIKDIEEINLLQKQIINHVCRYVKTGGILLYSTCTINKLENEWLIKDFLCEHQEFKILEEEIILPSNSNDGFYICKMIKGEVNE